MANIYVTDKEYALAKRYGIPKGRVDARIRKLGWSKNKAITQKIIRPNLKKWIKIAKSNGICRNTFISRHYVLGWSLERASTMPLFYRGST